MGNANIQWTRPVRVTDNHSRTISKCGRFTLDRHTPSWGTYVDITVDGQRAFPQTDHGFNVSEWRTVKAAKRACDTDENGCITRAIARKK